MPGKQACALLAALVVVTACGDATAVEDPFTPTEVASLATSNGAAPTLTVTQDGTSILSWVSAPDGGTAGELHLTIQPLDGTAQQATVVDSLGGIQPHGESPPQLSASGQQVYAVYNVGQDAGTRFPRSALRLVRSEDGGATWSAPVSVNEGPAFGSHAFHAVLAGPDGVVYVAWLSSAGPHATVWLRASADGGRTWQPARSIYSDPTCPCCRTALALAPDGRLYLAFRNVAAGSIRDIVVISTSDGGATWSAPVAAHAHGWVFDGCPHAGPSIRVDAAGAVHLFWWTGKEGATGVWYARSTDQGATWRSEAIDTASRGAPAHVQMQFGPAGETILAWDDGLTRHPRILLRGRATPEAAFGPTLVASAAGYAATYPVVGVVRDSVTIAWTQVTDSLYRAELAARPDMSNPEARMGLPRVGQQEVLTRRTALRRLLPE